jgi:hypothetical protein
VNPAIASILALYPLPTTTRTGGVGSIPEVDSTVGNENYFLARMDYTLSDKDSLFVRYVKDSAGIVYPFLG